ncbi:MAG: porin family protein [Armatimonadetes bacterium]|nr:porin family protein [Armatimonadota bacterium]
MMKRWMCWSALSALTALLSVPAVAQFEEGVLRVRAGAFFPSDVDLQNFNKTWFAVGLTYETAGISLLSSDATELSVDLFAHHTGGSRGTITSLLFTQVYERPVADTDSKWQIRLGAGLYVVDTTGPSENVFGGRIGLTYWVNEYYSVEVNYDITDRFGPNNDRASGLSVTVGYRF